jgi:hypothetical protein
MKPILIISFIALLSFGFSTDIKAQSNLEAGIRVGKYISFDATIPVGLAPRLHPAVYFDRFGIGSYLDWVFVLPNGPEGLRFYPGIGPTFWFEGDFDFDIAGNFGVEYAFDFPLVVGLDWRPAFRTTDDFDFRTGNFGVTARFRFGEVIKFAPANE